MTLPIHRKSPFWVGLLLLVTFARANAQVAVSEGVTFDSQAQTFTYKYAIDNRQGLTYIDELIIVVGPGFYSLKPFPPITQTESPPVCHFEGTAVTGGIAPLQGTV